MRCLVAAALVAAAASTASANPYLGLGIGTSASPSGDITMTTSDGERTGRLLGGYSWDTNSWGRISAEGLGSRYGFFRGGAPYQGTSIGAAVKFNYPLGDQFEVFGRGGLQRTWLSADGTAGLVGNGWLLGAGFEYRVTVAGYNGSVFVDYQRMQTNLTLQSDMRTTRDEGIGVWTLGATVSL